MKYDTAPAFDADFKRLKDPGQRLFVAAVRKRRTVVVEKSDGARAMLKPVAAKSPRRLRAKATTGNEAFCGALGGWKGLVDGERLKKDLASTRGSRRPPARL